jgi:hypothetical protein
MTPGIQAHSIPAPTAHPRRPTIQTCVSGSDMKAMARVAIAMATRFGLPERPTSIFLYKAAGGNTGSFFLQNGFV